MLNQTNEERENKKIILVVDDDPVNLNLAKKILGNEYRIAAANSGMAIFKYLEKNEPDLILLDINMPEMDGFEAIDRLKKDEHHAHIPVIFLTADKNATTETRCFQVGAIDYVSKPFIPDVLLSRVRRTLELEEFHHTLQIMVEKQADIITARTTRIADIQEKVIMGMANLIESRDGSTGMHVKNTQLYVKLITQELVRKGMFLQQLTEAYISNLCKAAPLHDVGKIKIPDSILCKPGRLTEEEYECMKKHTSFSEGIIHDIIGNVEEEEYVKLVTDIAMYHHERWDGTGYPKGLKGEEIPLGARIMAVADVFDALYETRCYKKPIRPIEKVLDIIKEGSGTQFDARIAETFVQMLPQLKLVCKE